ncbi:MAG TPA: alpha/beta hydrolase [Vicinamibacteria bacterium]|nr:alpha/beta hydrolase [Vicinamibacteria bacterium]
MSGPAAAPPLVLLAGARGTSLMWAPHVASLSRCHRVYALDLITDIGLSTPGREFRKPEDLVRWLNEVFGVLEPDRPLDLMGISYGGWLAALYAFRFPDRVRKAVLLAPGGAVHRLSLAFCLRVALLCIPTPGRTRADRPGTLQRILRWMFADTLRGGEAGRAHVEWMAAQIDAGRFYARSWMMWSTVLGDEEWRRFSVPALLLVGENERIYSPRKVMRRMNRVAPAVRTEIVPGAGHDLMFAKGDLVVEKVQAFLDGDDSLRGQLRLEQVAVP